MTLDANWINAAISAIQNGLAEKLVKGNVTVYRCGSNIIRIDINTKNE